MGINLPDRIREATPDDSIGLLKAILKQLGGGEYNTLQRGWSRSGKLISGVFDSIIDLQANLQESDTYTVQFDVTPPNTIVTRTVALIQFTVEGNTVFRMVDVTPGTSISGRGQRIKVQAACVSLNNPGTPYDLSIGVSKGVRAGFQTPPTLLALAQQVLTPSASQAIGVPGTPAGAVEAIWPGNPPAGVNSVLIGALPASGTLTNPAEVQVTFTDGGSNVLFSYDPLVQDGFVPIPAGTIEVNIINVDTRSVAISAIWGIEG